ncbi:MAG: TlpA disulfide reductase family protein [Rhodobacteraceae bacterium]|nr:TlpA disulfide reductase family protein [Paracoccaceae bacterium]
MPGPFGDDMRRFGLFVLYTALALGANATRAEMALTDPAVFQPFLTGDMAKLVPTIGPVALPAASLMDQDDSPKGLEDYRGKILLVNFWATWCAPCRKELATLDRLQAELGGNHFAVVTIATGPNPLPAIQKLFTDEKISHLPVLRDPNQGFARGAGVLALPVSLIVDGNGNEVARLLGDAVWDGPEAKALIAGLIAAAAP